MNTNFILFWVRSEEHFVFDVQTLLLYLLYTKKAISTSTLIELPTYLLLYKFVPYYARLTLIS